MITSADAPIDCLITLTPMNIVQAAADLVWSPVLRKFPDLKVALSEGGIGWIPYFLERVDYNYDRHHAWTGQDFGDMLPSEVFNRSVLTCFIDDRFGVASREFLDMDNVMWECDYPHSDSTWPMAPETLAKSLDGVCDHDIDRITHLNAMRHFHYDPFTALGGRELHGWGAPQTGGRPRRLHQVPVEGEHRQGGTRSIDLLSALRHALSPPHGVPRPDPPTNHHGARHRSKDSHHGQQPSLDSESRSRRLDVRPRRRGRAGRLGRRRHQGRAPRDRRPPARPGARWASSPGATAR